MRNLLTILAISTISFTAFSKDQLSCQLLEQSNGGLLFQDIVRVDLSESKPKSISFSEGYTNLRGNIHIDIHGLTLSLSSKLGQSKTYIPMNLVNKMSLKDGGVGTILTDIDQTNGTLVCYKVTGDEKAPFEN